MIHPTTLYLHAVAAAEQPGAGWRVSGDHELTNAAGDRVSIRIRFHGQSVNVRRANGQHGGGFSENIDHAWRHANEQADATEVTP